MLTNQRPKGAVRLYALRFMVYGGPSNAMTVVVPRNETPKAALGTIGGSRRQIWVLERAEKHPHDHDTRDNFFLNNHASDKCK